MGRFYSLAQGKPEGKKPDNRKRQRDTDAEDTNAGDKQQPGPKKARTGENRSLFVRSLPENATDEALAAFFSEHYPVKHAIVVKDPKTKTSKGYGFVTFTDQEDTQEAVSKLNNSSFEGKKLRLEIAEARHRDASKKIKGGSAVHNKVAEEKKKREEAKAEAMQPAKLIIRNLPWSIKKSEQLADLFKKFGKVRFSDLPQDKGKLAGFGFVTLRGRKNAEKALEAMNGMVVDGRTVAVDWAVDKATYEQHKGDEEKPKKEKKEKKTKVTKEAEEEDEEEEKEPKEKKSMTQEEEDLENFMKNHFENLEEEDSEKDEDEENSDEDEEEEKESDDADDDEDEDDEDDEDVEDESDEEGGAAVDEKPKQLVTDNSTTVFIRNLPFTATDATLKEHFTQFGPVRYARVVMDKATDRPAGTGFVCFFNIEDSKACVKSAPKQKPAVTSNKHSILQNESIDEDGRYTMDGRVLSVAQAVNKDDAARLTSAGMETRDRDKRRLYLLAEGQIPASSPLFRLLPAAEVKMREESQKQRKKMIQGNPALHLSLTRLAVRNVPKNIGSKELKALAREAVVGFAKDVKAGKRQPLSKEELARGGPEMKEAERDRKAKGKGIVRQAKIVFETKEGAKVTEDAGAAKSRGYGFIEYVSHRQALMGLRWLNGHALKDEANKNRRLIVEFAIENANVVQRRKTMEEKSRQPREPSGRAPLAPQKGQYGKDKEDWLDKKSKGKAKAAAEGAKKSEPVKSKEEKKEDSKLAMRTKIIARKRQMRKKKSVIRHGK
jgi:nucleolar protein 4